MICKKCKAHLEWDPGDYCYTPKGWDYIKEEEPPCIDGSYHSEQKLSPPLSGYSSSFLTETDEGNSILLGGDVW